MAKSKQQNPWEDAREVSGPVGTPDFTGETPPADVDLRAEVARLSGELARVMKLLGESTEGHETPETKAYKAWAQLSAKDKTQLVLAKEFPDNEPGTRPFDVRLVGPDGKPTEHFPLRLPAHSVEEAEGRYRKIMGINKTDGKIVAVAAA